MSIITSFNKHLSSKSYPKLMINTSNKNIHLFSTSTDTVILTSINSNEIGKVFTVHNIDYYEDYNDPITLKNS
jgi:hypothetical protein